MTFMPSLPPTAFLADRRENSCISISSYSFLPCAFICFFSHLSLISSLVHVCSAGSVTWHACLVVRFTTGRTLCLALPVPLPGQTISPCLQFDMQNFHILPLFLSIFPIYSLPSLFPSPPLLPPLLSLPPFYSTPTSIIFLIFNKTVFDIGCCRHFFVGSSDRQCAGTGCFCNKLTSLQERQGLDRDIVSTGIKLGQGGGDVCMACGQ